MPVMASPPPVDPAALQPFLDRQRAHAAALKASGNPEEAAAADHIESFCADLENEIGWIVDQHRKAETYAAGEAGVELAAEGHATPPEQEETP